MERARTIFEYMDHFKGLQEVQEREPFDDEEPFKDETPEPEFN